MGIFDSIFHAKPKAPDGSKHTLVVFDWDSFSHEQDYHFLEQYENPVLWFVTRGKWDPRWDVLKSKYPVTYLQVPAYERSLISFLICSLIFEVASNRIYKRVIIAAGHSYFKGTVSFLLEKKILAELHEVEPRFPHQDRDRDRDRDRGNQRRGTERSEQSSNPNDRRQRPTNITSERTERPVNRERDNRDMNRDRGDRERETPNRESRDNSRVNHRETGRETTFRDREPVRERDSRDTRDRERDSRDHRNERDHSGDHTRDNRTERNDRNKETPQHPLRNREATPTPPPRNIQNSEETKLRNQPERKRNPDPEVTNTELRKKGTEENDNRNEQENRGEGLTNPNLPTPDDLKLIVNYFNQHYLVGETYQKSYFGMLIKQATRRTAPEVLGSKNAKPFIQVLMRNGCIDQLDSQTFKVLKPVELEMFSGSFRPSTRRRPPNRTAKRRPTPTAD